ncbi:MAG: hypothetical protein QG640_430 [Patescibacteria group bacterium]|nr:hypothetical protein [Patescibacteria group bacterium]
MSIHFLHWASEDEQALSKAQSFEELARVALNVIAKIEGEIHMVSGPISTGGVGTVPGNLYVFEKIIEMLSKDEGFNIFSQIPFQAKMDNLCQMWQKMNQNEIHCIPILENFYKPLFSSGRIAVVHFIHGWESSFGSRWEHDFCKKNTGIRIEYLPKELSKRALKDNDNIQLYE